jgi:hypothetical protein
MAGESTARPPLTPVIIYTLGVRFSISCNCA